MKRTFIFMSLLFAAFFLSSCEREKEGNGSFTFNASIENLDTDDPAAKVHLVDEQWIYWELGDNISIASDQSSSQVLATLTNTGGPNYPDFNGTFISELPWSSKYFLGLFPYSENNVISGSPDSKDFSATIELPATQPLRNDLTFARKVFPMVAWYGGHWDENAGSVAYNLDFQSLAGIVRLQFCNTSSDVSNVKEVRVTSTDGKQLKGMFSVRDYNTFEPYLVPAGGSGDNTVTLSCGDEGRPFGVDTLISFYLVLPTFDPSVDANKTYALTVEIENMNGNVCTRNLTARVRRSGITYMRALEVTNWTSGTTAVRLSGNGTAERPFRIYSAADLIYLRDCYNSSTRTINNIPITNNTHIWLMRTDIELTSTNWNQGIQHFVGHFEDNSNGTHPGITSTSIHPLFESVDPGGTVERITLKSEVSYNGSSAFSPFCITNRGTLKDCILTYRPVNTSGVISSSFADLAGLCVTNNGGTIQGCRNEANLSASGHNIGVICHTNQGGGVVKECELNTPFTVSRASAVGGIVYDNQAGCTVRDCYYAVSTTASTSRWGGIVYQNRGTVEKCYINNTIITTLSLGGIVNKQLGGVINYCDCRAQLHSPNVGGIVDTISGGQIINCFVNHVNAQIVHTTSTAPRRSAGGIAAYQLGGSIENSYVYIPHITTQGSDGSVGGTVGTYTGGIVNNVYCYETSAGTPLFFGAYPAGTYAHCYLVGGTQTGVTSKTTSEAATDAFVTTLNNGVPTGGKSWQLSGIPVLEPYTQP